MDEIKNDITFLKAELNNRLLKIVEKSNMILDLKIQLSEKDIEIFKLRKEIVQLCSEHCPKHALNQ